MALISRCRKPIAILRSLGPNENALRFIRGINMRRTFHAMASVIMVYATVFVARDSIAQDVTPDTATHPVVGSWMLTLEPGMGIPLPSLGNFAADGGYTQLDPNATMALGAWEATGDTTADATFIYVGEEDGMNFVRASVEVAGDGQSFSGTYTISFLDPDTGEMSEEFGPGTVDATRIVVEAPGTPTAPF